MAKTDITRQKIKSKISAIKKINDRPQSIIDASYDAYKDNLESIDGLTKKTINNFKSKIKGGTENKKDIFGEILDITESFLGSEKDGSINLKTNPILKSKIIKYSKDSARKTLQISRQIINDEARKKLIGLCNSNTTIGTTSINLSPKSFDFVNMLKVDPSTISGKLMYEDDTSIGDVKFNKKLYEQFDAGSPYSFTTKDGASLFTMEWNSSTQEYIISGLTPTMKIGEFLSNYYNSIEFSDVEHVFKNAMLMTLQGDGTESIAFKNGMKSLNRISTKLLSVCGNPSNNGPLLNNTPQQLTEDETDTQNYFNFDDTEGIDLDDEDAASRRVLKFTDCNNFESPVNSNHIEDFAYLLGRKNFDENIMNTLNKAAMDAYEQSDSSIPFDGFQLSLTGSYILKIPRAVISSALSPKIFFPIALVYKDLKGTNVSVTELMKNLSNLFFNVVKTLFWNFIKEFWHFIKRDILVFVKDTAGKILSNAYKKYKSIVKALIDILTEVTKINIGSCSDIFNSILSVITSALNKKINVPIPGLLLALSNKALPGYSPDRAYMNAIERMESAGINMGPLYGSENKFPSVIKSILDGHSEEMDSNSYVAVGLHSAIIPANGTNAYIIEGMVTAAGKLF